MAFADECATMMEDVTERLGATVTLTSVSLGTLSTSSALTRAETTQSQSIGASRRPRDMEVAAAANSQLAVEVRLYDIAAADVTIGGGVPKIGWRITDGGDTFEIADVDRQCDGACYTLTARRAA